jgi:hypothetical protein
VVIEVGEAYPSSFSISSGTGLSSDFTVEIRDSSNNLLASKTENFTDGQITFSESDYSRIPGDETVSVTVSSTSEPFEYGEADSDYSGTVFSISAGSQVNDGVPSIEVTQNVFNSNGSFTSKVQNLGYQATKLTLTADYTLNGQSISFELQDGSGNTIKSVSESQIGETISISTTVTSYRLKGILSSDGSKAPDVNNYEVGLDD